MQQEPPDDVGRPADDKDGRVVAAVRVEHVADEALETEATHRPGERADPNHRPEDRKSVV